MHPAILLLSCATLLALLGIVALRLPAVLRVIVLVQIVYWALAYVVRPSVLFIVRPSPRIGDALFDPRLSFDDYTGTFAAVLGIITGGLLAYVAVLYLYSYSVNTGRDRRLIKAGSPDYHPLVRALLAATAIGWLGRVVLLLSPENRLAVILGLVASAGVIGLILIATLGRRRDELIVLSALVASELAWSALTASKTPILGAVLALVMRVVVRGDRIRLIPTVGLTALAFSFFAIVQRLKIGQSDAQEIASADAAYPTVLQPFMAVLRRFDLFNAVTDAHLLGASSWRSGEEFTSTAGEVVVPGFLQSDAKISLGQAWASEVRATSLSGANTDVSLAFGPIAEGWATGGVWGLVIQSIALVAVLHICYLCLTSSSPGRFALGCLMIAYPVAFERGLLGNLALISQDLQAVALIAALGLILRPRRSASSPITASTSRTNQRF